jgi:hypothetical protein
MHLDLAVAPRRQAETAFFADDGEAEAASDGIPRVRLEGLTEFELATLGGLLAGSFEPRLALDGDCPEDIVSECDPGLTRALAALAGPDLSALAIRWGHALADASPATPTRERLESALAVLRELASTAMARRHALLYTQELDQAFDDPDLD